MKRILRQTSLFIVLIPLFFVLHVTVANLSYISWGDALLAVVLYTLVFSIVYFLLRFIFRNGHKAGLLLFVFQIIFFFFSSFHSSLKTLTHNGLLSSYSFLLPSIALLIVLVIIWLRKSGKNFYTLNQFINSIALFLILSELFLLVYGHYLRNTTKSVAVQRELKIRIPDSLKRNCYFLIYDAYAHSSYLKKRFGYTNPLDSLLANQGFYVYPKSKSNYNFTHFSIASALNIKYAQGLRNDSVTREDYARALNEIRNNSMVPYFESNGFRFINLSFFDIKHHPAVIQSNYLPKGLVLFNELTFFSHVYEDIGWHLFDPKNPKLQQLVYHRLNEQKKSNQTIDEEIERYLSETSRVPILVYAHYNMPHPPYFFDSSGNERPLSLVYSELKDETKGSNLYLPHLVFTNKKILAVVNKIMTAEKGNAVIIIAGDHGNREKNTRDEMFDNFTAIYTPAQYRHLLKKDSISLINVFPTVLNAVYGQNVPFMPDSQFFLSDAPGSKW